MKKQAEEVSVWKVALCRGREAVIVSKCTEKTGVHSSGIWGPPCQPSLWGDSTTRDACEKELVPSTKVLGDKAKLSPAAPQGNELPVRTAKSQ